MVRGDDATHEEIFLSNWFREDVDGNAEEREKGKKENQSGRRQGWAKRGGERMGKGRDEQQTDLNTNGLLVNVKCFPFRRLGVLEVSGFILKMFQMVFAS